MSASTFAKTVFEALLFVFFDIKYFLGICLRCCRKSHQDELFNAVSRGSPKEVQEILDRGYKINDIMTISVKAYSKILRPNENLYYGHVTVYKNGLPDIQIRAKYIRISLLQTAIKLDQIFSFYIGSEVVNTLIHHENFLFEDEFTFDRIVDSFNGSIDGKTDLDEHILHIEKLKSNFICEILSCGNAEILRIFLKRNKKLAEYRDFVWGPFDKYKKFSHLDSWLIDTIQTTHFKKPEKLLEMLCELAKIRKEHVRRKLNSNQYALE